MKNETLKESEHKQLAEAVRVSSLYERYKAQMKGGDDGRAASNKV